MSRYAPLFPCLIFCVLLSSGCGEEESTAGAIQLQRLQVAGSQPPANPTANSSTPSTLNFALAQTYQRERQSDASIERVVILMPGFLGGANDFDYLGPRLIERSTVPTAVWAIDRRSNALEDQTGFDAAETQHDPEIAKQYYFGGAAIGGKTFAGFVNGTDVPFMSEWGIRTHIEDLDALVSAAIRRYPHASMFLGGHSLGASIVPIYAAWDFGAYAGFERLAGLILLEGGPVGANPGAAVPRQEAYEGSAGIKSIRAGNPITNLPFITTELFAAAEIIGMRTHHAFGHPDAPTPDKQLFTAFFSTLFGLQSIPNMTNAAALGFGFDNDFQPLSFARASIGAGSGGTIGDNPNAAFFGSFVGPGEKLLGPLDVNGNYSWLNRTQQPAPADPSDIDTFAGILYRGPSNFIEWYFPARINVDVGVVGALNVGRSGDWRKDAYGLAVTENARVDLPVFAVGGSRGLLSDLTRLNPYRASIAPRLRNGADRGTTPAGFQTILADRFVHLDVLTAYDDNPQGNGVFEPMVEWMDAAQKISGERH